MLRTASVVWWLACLTIVQGSIHSYTLQMFLGIWGMERGPLSLMRSSEIRL